MKRALLLMIALAALAACHKRETPAASPAKPTSSQPAAKSDQHRAPTMEPQSASTNVGDVMPAYSAKLLDGSPFDLASEKGHVVLLNVWATWCGPCRFEIPELQKMYEKNSSRGFKVVGVSVDEGDDKEVKQFVTEQKMTYPVALDPDGRIANLLQTTVLPTTLLIDRNGKIVWREVGAIPAGEPTLAKALETALGGS
jgi:cytochrome c biogenesis protein CcmG/thiol:disulfide interchange protein DsbE